MPKSKRNGARKTRDQFSRKRVPELGYYFIVTDTKETERNYILGLKNTVPDKLKEKIVIRVKETKTKNLVDEARELAALFPQYGEPWIIFDRDQVKNFDEIISQAESCNIKVGWSNPCIEIWFSAYFGTMPTYDSSVACCSGFAKTFSKVSNQKYLKDDSDIYRKLNKYGSEKSAIRIAKQKHEEHLRNGYKKPSELIPCTTVHLLVEEINDKIKEK